MEAYPRPDDEYDVYADRLVSMIASRASDAELLRYLKAVQTEEMGLKAFDAKRGRKVIAAIRANMKLPQHASRYD